MKLSRFILFLIPLISALLCGCRSFEKDWAAVPASAGGTGNQALGTASLPITGRWIGTWQNTNNTHAGPLRAVVWQESENRLRARFHAGWGSRSGSFTSPLDGAWNGSRYAFTGRRRIFGVLIETTGDITADNFSARYDSRFDRGTFTLHRE